MNLLFGCDPELFVKHKASGKYVSAHDLLPGTKEKPYPVVMGAIQVDGVAAEFNIHPVADFRSWENNITVVIGQLQEKLGDEYSLETVPCVIFDSEYFNKLPESTRELGCNMDYNAWTGQPNPAPKGDATTMRTASGHIHFGFTDGEDVRDSGYIEDCAELVRQLDFYLGIPSLMWDNDPRRRELYGKAGAFRPKPYGLEYRTLSNRWLINPTLRQWVFKAGQEALLNMFSGKNKRMASRFGDLAQNIIDKNQYSFAASMEFRNEIWSHTGVKWPTWKEDVRNAA